MSYYLGEIIFPEGKNRTELKVRDIEAAMIYYHYKYQDILRYNDMSTSSYNGRDLIIINEGKIPPKIVNFENEDDYWGKI